MERPTLEHSQSTAGNLSILMGPAEGQAAASESPDLFALLVVPFIKRWRRIKSGRWSNSVEHSFRFEPAPCRNPHVLTVQRPHDL